jgi:hypothetical protein
MIDVSVLMRMAEGRQSTATAGPAVRSGND